MKIFSTFSGIGGFEVGIQNAYRSTFGGGEEDTEGNKGQGLFSQKRESIRAEERSLSERTSNIIDERPLFVGYSEIDKFATSVYEKHFKGAKNYGDITKIKAEELPDFDCLVGGFPCQAFSIAGKRRGFEDTRGTLFFDLARILRAKQPRLFVFENVKGLLSHRYKDTQGREYSTFETIIATIDELGYDCQWQVLNSKNFGVPQNRDRVIIVGHLRGTRRPEVFPFREDYGETYIPESEKGTIVDLTLRSETGFKERKDNRAGTVDANYYKGIANQERPGVVIGTLRTHKDGNGFRQMSSGNSPTIPARAREDGSGQPVIMIDSAPSVKVYSDGSREEFITEYDGEDNPVGGKWVRIPEATKKGYAEATVGQSINLSNPNSKTRRGRVSDISPTIETLNQIHTLTPDIRIRRITPLECERLQGFPDNWTKLGVGEMLPDESGRPYINISDTQRYKMCGNAVTTNVIQAVFERIFDEPETL